MSEEWSTFAESLLRAERARPKVPASTRDELFDAIMSKIGAGGGPAGSAADPMAGDSVHDPARGSTTPASTLGSLLQSKPLLVTASLLIGGAAGAYLRGVLDRPESPAPASTVPGRSPSPPSAGEERTGVLSVDELPTSTLPTAKGPDESARATPRSAPTRPSQPRPGGLEAERKIIETARSALQRGDDRAALDALRTHEKAHASGQLSEEREALFVQALAHIGRLDEARARADAFKQAYPRSVLLPLVDAAIE